LALELHHTGVKNKTYSHS